MQSKFRFSAIKRKTGKTKPVHKPFVVEGSPGIRSNWDVIVSTARRHKGDPDRQRYRL